MPRIEKSKEDYFEFFERVFTFDIKSEYERLKEVGRLPDSKLKDRNELLKQLNQAAYNAFRASMIWQRAKKEREIFRLKFDSVLSDLRKTVISELTEWMRNEGAKKQITKDMVDSELSSNPVVCLEYQELIREQERFREIRDNCEALAKQWNNRVSTLQSQARLMPIDRDVHF